MLYCSCAKEMDGQQRTWLNEAILTIDGCGGQRLAPLSHPAYKLFHRYRYYLFLQRYVVAVQNSGSLLTRFGKHLFEAVDKVDTESYNKEKPSGEVGDKEV